MNIRLDIGHYLPIGDPLGQSLYLQPFSRYWPLRALGSRPWHFRVTWRQRPFDTQVAISYRNSIVTKSLSPAIFNIMGTKHIEVTTLTFQGHETSSVTKPFDSQVAISYMCSIVTNLYLQPFPRYLALSILGPWPWPFRVTWRHRSREHSIPTGPIPIGTPLSSMSLSQAISSHPS